MQIFNKKDYGYNVIFYELNRHGNYYTVISRNTLLTTMKLKYNTEIGYNRDRFSHDSFEIKKRSEKSLLKSFSFLKQYPISESTLLLTSELKERYLVPVFELAETQLNFKGTSIITSKVLPIQDYLLRILNSNNDISGPGYKVINFIMKNLFKINLRKLCFNSFKGTEAVDHIIFDVSLSDKEWSNLVLESIINYVSPVEILDQELKLLDFRIQEYKNQFKFREFSPGDSLKDYSLGSKKYEDSQLFSD